MQPSKAPPESQGKDEESGMKTGALSRFKALAGKLFDLDAPTFREERIKDEEKRLANRKT